MRALIASITMYLIALLIGSFPVELSPALNLVRFICYGIIGLVMGLNLAFIHNLRKLEREYNEDR
jgi:hypothetical protein